MASYSSVSLKKSLGLIHAFAWRTRPKSVELIAKGIKMKPFLFALLTGLGLFCFEVSKAQAQTVRRPQNCGPREAVVARLAKAYGEVRKSRGLGTNNAVVEVFASDKTGSWTITITMPSGLTCLVASGQAFETLAKVEPLLGDEI
jgi:hypothetical protein